jgi:hypothetical protein
MSSIQSIQKWPCNESKSALDHDNDGWIGHPQLLMYKNWLNIVRKRERESCPLNINLGQDNKQVTV